MKGNGERYSLLMEKISKLDNNATQIDKSTKELKKYLKMDTSVGLIKMQDFDDDMKNTQIISFSLSYLFGIDNNDDSDGEEREFGNPVIRIPVRFYIDNVKVFSSYIYIHVTKEPDYEIDIEDGYIIGKTVEEINEYIANTATIRDTVYNISSLVAIEVINKFKSVLCVANKSRYLTSEMEEFVKTTLKKIKITPRLGEVNRAEENKEPETETNTVVLSKSSKSCPISVSGSMHNSIVSSRCLNIPHLTIDDTDNKYINSNNDDEDEDDYKRGDDDEKEKDRR